MIHCAKEVYLIWMKSLMMSQGCLVQINGGGWRAFNTNAKAALHVAKNLINGRRAQVCFERTSDAKNVQFAFTKEVETVMKQFGDPRLISAVGGLSATTFYSV